MEYLLVSIGASLFWAMVLIAYRLNTVKLNKKYKEKVLSERRNIELDTEFTFSKGPFFFNGGSTKTVRELIDFWKIKSDKDVMWPGWTAERDAAAEKGRLEHERKEYELRRMEVEHLLSINAKELAIEFMRNADKLKDCNYHSVLAEQVFDYIGESVTEAE